MALKDKYKELVDTATASGVSKLQVREQDSVLYIDGEAPSGAVKDSNIQAAITELATTTPSLSGINADVKEGVVTLTGEFKDEASKAAAETAVKSI